ncbi:TetR/AcrR family transcriptional regulator [Streptomyces spectabilis]|uniref:AcrR family transcriptional regulator n=1 Tax=Streptomyces spectabilis TaxID=68270 RepID=A0A5P2X4Q8_STRST|nr:TetR/AcrR family transcriptional regulator [Streptomyces spectabilis]MBB5101529.1 AcrR family transcriptional regulator [Streptomyces spectabilis]MCI3900718.1 TetR/AcrR family transcriptional regulator [Streptomyces spectabilis]QEV58259.1 TetR/AcrR family transcriptional regulator [Streptomyces spectabilis]GGV11969.1 TetR family transcriptional regulator [Streptomyces spectabilis]
MRSRRNETAGGRRRQHSGRDGQRTVASASGQPQIPHRGGRPRDPAVEEAILAAARHRLAADGYARMTLGGIAADAGVSRPTLYRRWPGKYELTVDTLHYGLSRRHESRLPLDLDTMTPLEAFAEAVRRLDPCDVDPCAMALHGTFMAEAEREPDLFALVREQGSKPRCEEFLRTLRRLQGTGAVRADADLDAAVTLCHGSYFGGYLRTGRHTPHDLADRIVALLWPALRTNVLAEPRPAGGGPGHG